MRSLSVIFIGLSIISSAALAKTPLIPAIVASRAISSPDLQTSQIEAGYPMGCEITTLLYALKFGPSAWRDAYLSLDGTDDAKKIRALAAKLGALSSRDVPSHAAFSEQFGTDPNDLPWIFQTLVPGEAMKTLFNPLLPLEQKTSGPSLSKQLSDKIEKSLQTGRPVIAQLYYANPDFSHAILITGIDKQVASGEILISVIDPMTGKSSVAEIRPEAISLVGHKLNGLSFFDGEIIERKGVLLSVLI